MSGLPTAYRIAFLVVAILWGVALGILLSTCF